MQKAIGGQKSIEAKAGTVRDVIKDIESRFPGFAGQVMNGDGLHRFVIVYLNDEDVRFLQKLDTQIKDGDVLSVLPALAGGQPHPQMSNVDTVKGIYESFGRGDVPGILGKLAADVAWDSDWDSGGVPWLAPRSGRENVAGFFEALGALEITKFVPHSFLEGEGKVVALVDIAFVHKASGKAYDFKDEGHLWQFNEAGEVIRFQHMVPTHQHVEMVRGS